MRVLDVAVMGVLGASIAFYLFSEWFHYHRSTPPTPVMSYREFEDLMPVPAEFALLSVNDTTFLQVTGPVSWGLAATSGPPVYIFDATGVLVAWTPDSGDDPSFSSVWLRHDTRRAISSAQAVAQFGS